MHSQSKLTKDPLSQLLATAQQLDVLGLLRDCEIRWVTEAKIVLTTVQSNKRRNDYKLFLYNALRDSGPEAVLLCAIAFGKSRITELSIDKREDLSRLVKDNKNAFRSPAIRALSAQYQVPDSVESITSLLDSSLSASAELENDKQPVKHSRTFDLEVDKQSVKRSRTDLTSTTPSYETRRKLLEISNNRGLESSQEQEIIENASLQGIADVFDDWMCDAIRRVKVENELKAAVTMVTPLWGGPVDCVMSLDICEQHVDQLLMALFNAKVEWTETRSAHCDAK